MMLLILESTTQVLEKLMSLLNLEWIRPEEWFSIMEDRLLCLKIWLRKRTKNSQMSENKKVWDQVLITQSMAKPHLFFRSEHDLTLVSETRITYVQPKSMDLVQDRTNFQAPSRVMQNSELPCLLMAQSEWQPLLETLPELLATCP